MKVDLKNLTRRYYGGVLSDHSGTMTTDAIEQYHGLARHVFYARYGVKITPWQGMRLRGYGEAGLYALFKKHETKPGVLGEFKQGLFNPLVDHFKDDVEGFAQEHNETYGELVRNLKRQGRFPDIVRPGYPEFVLAAYEYGIPVGIVTNSYLDHVRMDAEEVVKSVNVLRKAKDAAPLSFEKVFAFVIAADNIKEKGLPPKPNPAPYLEGYRCLKKLRPGLKNMGQVLILEDSETGVIAGANAGGHVVHICAKEPHPFAVYSAAAEGCMDRAEINSAHPLAGKISKNIQRKPIRMSPSQFLQFFLIQNQLS